jgi:hypothetical protein
MHKSVIDFQMQPISADTANISPVGGSDDRNAALQDAYIELERQTRNKWRDQFEAELQPLYDQLLAQPKAGKLPVVDWSTQSMSQMAHTLNSIKL